jgi:hypothetical protein
VLTKAQALWSTGCVAVAGLVAAISSVAPWVTVGERDGGHFFSSWTITGWRYTGYLSEGSIGSTPSDPHHPGGIGGGAGDVTIVVGLLIAVLALSAMRSRGWGRRQSLLAALVALIGIVVPVLVLVSARHGNGHTHGHPVEQVRYGLWLTLGASVAAALASFWVLRDQPG